MVKFSTKQKGLLEARTAFKLIWNIDAEKAYAIRGDMISLYLQTLGSLTDPRVKFSGSQGPQQAREYSPSELRFEFKIESVGY